MIKKLRKTLFIHLSEEIINIGQNKNELELFFDKLWPICVEVLASRDGLRKSCIILQEIIK